MKQATRSGRRPLSREITTAGRRLSPDRSPQASRRPTSPTRRDDASRARNGSVALPKLWRKVWFVDMLPFYVRLIQAVSLDIAAKYVTILGRWETLSAPGQRAPTGCNALVQLEPTAERRRPAWLPSTRDDSRRRPRRPTLGRGCSEAASWPCMARFPAAAAGGSPWIPGRQD
jgi:hypothetical protein